MCVRGQPEISPDIRGKWRISRAVSISVKDSQSVRRNPVVQKPPGCLPGICVWHVLLKSENTVSSGCILLWEVQDCALKLTYWPFPHLPLKLYQTYICFHGYCICFFQCLSTRMSTWWSTIQAFCIHATTPVSDHWQWPFAILQFGGWRALACCGCYSRSIGTRLWNRLQGLYSSSTFSHSYKRFMTLLVLPW